MHVIHSTSDRLAIASQGNVVTLNINAYYSTVAAIKEEKLKDDQYRSNRSNILDVRICCHYFIRGV